ncbi:MAG TPA: 6-carboxytetrahydropterin synthase QueD [Planctomycetota bacterium]|nr:6-carboxytetrahydropterin synthase QueD [Planctomycetota bacterium]
MYELVLKTHFSAAHRLREYEGDCERLHGHNWAIEVRVRTAQLNHLGMVADFREVKRLVQEVIGRLDHHFLNDIPPFDEINPTTENIARFLFDGLAKALPEGVRPAGVTAWESEGCGVSYSDE